VSRFAVRSSFTGRYPGQQAGGQTIRELQIPADDLPRLNQNIIGRIQVTHTFT
jgi:hypothetical protein